MVFSDFFLLELLILVISIFFTTSNNILILLYNAGLYLVLLGLYALTNDADIYIGFLWVIDLGVGLVFFIFMLHFIPFLHQKTNYNFTKKHKIFLYLFIVLLGFYLYFFASTIDTSNLQDLQRTWVYNITYLDYYYIYVTNEITELNLLRETYFLVNSFEFFLINFSLLFGLITAVLLCFMIHRIFNFLNYAQIKNTGVLQHMDTNFFIRNQSFVVQANAPIATRVWSRNLN